MASPWEKQGLCRLLRESIVHLCKSNHIYGGSVEVDGIICITGKNEGQEMVLKVHERLGPTAADRFTLSDFLGRPRGDWAAHAGAPSCGNDGGGGEIAEDYSLKRRRVDESVEQQPQQHHKQEQLHRAHQHHRPQYQPLRPNPDADNYPNLKQHLLASAPQKTPDNLCAKDLTRCGPGGVIDIRPTSPPPPPAPGAQDTGFSTSGDSSISPQASGGGGGGGGESTSGRGTSQHNHSSSASASPSPVKFQYTSTPHSMYPKRIPLRSDRWSPSQPIPTIPECKPCGHAFSSFDNLSEHNEAVHSVFTCQCCFKTFTSRSNLERHSRLHSGHKPYACNICGKAFSRKDHLSNHATKHAFKCGTCSKRFADKKMLVTHYQYDHNAILTNICEFCNKGFSSYEAYEEHVKIHPQYHNGGVVVPRHGADGEDDADSSPRSRSSSRSPVPSKFYCKSCGFSTGDKLTLLKHNLVHGDGARCYTCLACAKTFDDPLRYSDHLLIHPDDVNIFECALCRQICSTLPSLRRHEATHLSQMMDDDIDDDMDDDLDDDDLMMADDDDDDELDDVVDDDEEEEEGEIRVGESAETAARGPTSGYPCHECQRVFLSRYILKEHMEMHQKLDGHLVCPVCSDDFSSYADLGQHMEDAGHNVALHPRHHPREAADLPHKPAAAATAPLKAHIIIPATVATTASHNGPDVCVSPQSTRKAKRKQTLPKAIKAAVALDHEESDFEVVQPESPGGMLENAACASPRKPSSQLPQPPPAHSSSVPSALVIEARKAVVADDDATGSDLYSGNGVGVVVGQYVADQDQAMEEGDSPIKMGPVKSLLSRTIINRAKDKASSNNNNNNVEVKGEEESPEPAAFPIASPSPGSAAAAEVGLEESPAAGGSDIATTPPNNNNNSIAALSLKLVNVDIPPGPYTCAICSATISCFQELEMHCFGEHNRSPCMFCTKTFAQKANRDRHVCLHTGEKPYSCPECAEKFSRGDKLKIHRVRAHQIQFPSYGSRGGGGGGEKGGHSVSRELSLSPSPSLGASQDSLTMPRLKDDWPPLYNDATYSAGEWRLQKPVEAGSGSQLVHAAGEWIKDGDSSPGNEVGERLNGGEN